MKHTFTCTFDVPEDDDLQESHIVEEIMLYLDSFPNGITVNYSWTTETLDSLKALANQRTGTQYGLEAGESITFPVSTQWTHALPQVQRSLDRSLPSIHDWSPWSLPYGESDLRTTCLRLHLKNPADPLCQSADCPPFSQWWAFSSILNSVHKKSMYEIQCPYAPEENEVTMDVDRAMSICLDLAEEFGYACVRDAFGNMYGDYGDVIQAVEDGVIWPHFLWSICTSGPAGFFCFSLLRVSPYGVGPWL